MLVPAVGREVMKREEENYVEQCRTGGQNLKTISPTQKKRQFRIQQFRKAFCLARWFDKIDTPQRIVHAGFDKHSYDLLRIQQSLRFVKWYNSRVSSPGWSFSIDEMVMINRITIER